ncbi:triple tyrosine motif-containing protein [Flavobacterium sp. NG2]|uniref:triple tyrosine motif-containing protein n=1 Tax=Flavobacterium sp. NG2 TaxID=3097547 RepID=UPI002A801012|nr:triple tyrosine motif-containing protein [Flavobacterium sp. NG2]WPR72645.1 triple tyrosine motif-containing protein [Flavobacterium sp. NG2]
MRLSVFIILLLVKTTCLFSQIKNIGLPEITNYKRSEFKGAAQNWNINQDKNGNLYFANNSGLLQFDGVRWTKYQLPVIPVVRSLKIAPSGKIFVGGYNEFGYFESNSNGKLIYQSISNLIKSKKNEVLDMIWKIHFYKDEVIFQTFNAIYIYKNNKLRTLKAPNKFQFSFQLKNKIYVQDVVQGLMEYKQGILFPLKGTTALNNTEIWGIFEQPNNELLIATLDRGLFTYKDSKIEPWNTDVNAFIKKNSCLGGVRINKNQIVINSILNGVVICDNNGKIIQHINREKGLQNNTVLTSFVDNRNNLWLGLDNGISFVNESSPFTFMDYSFGISTVYASVLHNGYLYVATNQGLFYHSWNEQFKEDGFVLVEGTTGQAWNIQVIDNQLICAHNRGALVVSGGKSTKIGDDVGYWTFRKSANNPNYLIGSSYNGFSVFEKKSNGWVFKNRIKGFNKSVETFEIDENSIWLKKDDIVYQLMLTADFKIKLVKKHQNLSPSTRGIQSFQRLNGAICFQKNNQFFKYSYEQELFYEDKGLTKLFKNISPIDYFHEDRLGNIWYIFKQSLGALMKKEKGIYKNELVPFSNLTGNLVPDFLSVNTIDPENILIGLTDGLAHYNSKASNNFIAKPKAFIRTLTVPSDTLYLSNINPKMEDLKFPYSSNQVKFTFSSPAFENLQNIEFSYKLVGFDKKWSAWSTNSIKEYTNLREGNYLMKLKVRNSYGIQSDETTVEFAVSPPWYRHFLAYILYLGLAVAAVILIRKRIKMKIRKNKYFEKIEQRRLYLEKETKILQERYKLVKEIEKLENEKLQMKLLAKDKELVMNSLQSVKKNKILNGIISKLKDFNINSFDESTKTQFSRLNKSIVKEVNSDKSWKDLEKHIKNVHFDFLKRLKEKYPTISPRELDLATYLLMNMSTKEIADVMNISTGGVELARYRLRKKLELNKKENLTGFLMSI